MERTTATFVLVLTGLILTFFATTIHSCNNAEPEPAQSDRSVCFEQTRLMHSKCLGPAGLACGFGSNGGAENKMRALECTERIEPMVERCFTLGPETLEE